MFYSNSARRSVENIVNYKKSPRDSAKPIVEKEKNKIKIKLGNVM